MITINQELWNLLFGWMISGQCMIPEGCTVPLTGILMYAVLLIIICSIIYWRKHFHSYIIEFLDENRDED